MRIFLLLTLLLVPNWSLAGEYYLEVGNDSPSLNEKIEVTALINTTDKANVVSGSLIYDQGHFTIDRITIGNSIVSFWIEKPSEREDGAVSFSGMVAGGFAATEAKLFTVELTPLKIGESTMEIKEMFLLAHDGLGTALPVSALPLTIKVDDNQADLAELADDTESPENFTPEIIKRDDWFDGKAVLIFDTTDKGSGVDAYYVKEVKFAFLAPFSSWRQVTSPYVINDQSLRSFIYIKAEDRMGNAEVVEVLPDNPRVVLPWIILALLIIILLIVYGARTNVKSQSIEK